MIRKDRELLAKLARLTSDVTPLAMRVMEGSATADEQRAFAARLTQLGEQLRRRADEMGEAVMDGEVILDENITLPAHTVQLDWRP